MSNHDRLSILAITTKDDPNDPLITIVSTCPNVGPGEIIGLDQYKNEYRFITNFDRVELPVFKQAVAEYQKINPVIVFGVSDEIYHYNSDCGFHYSVSPREDDGFGLYATSNRNLDEFWAIHRKIKDKG